MEELLHPERAPEALDDEDLVRRYHVHENSLMLLESWLYRMINTKRPLEEKLSLFWHRLFATGYTKLNQPKAILGQIECSGATGWAAFETCWSMSPETRQ